MEDSAQSANMQQDMQISNDSAARPTEAVASPSRRIPAYGGSFDSK